MAVSKLWNIDISFDPLKSFWLTKVSKSKVPKPKVPELRVFTLKKRTRSELPKPQPESSNGPIGSHSIITASHSETSNCDHQVPRLPPEVIWIILECLTEWFSPYEVDFIISPYRNPKREPTTHQLVGRAKSYFNGLRNRTLVCRRWHHITQRHLYSQPILISSRQLRLFRRSLESNPSLANLVVEVRLSDNSRSFRFGLRLFGTRSRHAKRAERMREDACYILTMCKGMESIALHTSSLPFTNSIGNVLNRRPIFEGHHIRKLTLSGAGQYRTDIDSPSFDNLERLIIQNSEYRPRGWHPFPELLPADHPSKKTQDSLGI